jgi:hypothetical protein
VTWKLPLLPFWERPGDDSKANSFSSSTIFLVDNRCFGPAGECQIIGVARAAADLESTGMTWQFSCQTG